VPLLLVLVLLGVLGAVAVVAAGRGGSMADAPRDRAPGPVLPEGEVSAGDVDRVTFSLAFRGYRMDEVDQTLERLGAQLAERDARIAELEGGTTAGRVEQPGAGHHPDAPDAPAPAPAEET
jgi:DivIVA domain-containing protein